MKLGVFDPVFGAIGLEPMLDRVHDLGLEAVEIGTGGYPGDARCRPGELLADRAARRRFASAFGDRGLEISAFSCHGNPLHPDATRAAADDATYRDTVRLAAELGVERVNLFSGCPGDGPSATHPNWVTCAWPPDFREIVEWQWEAVVLPYWREAGGFARDYGVRLGIEMHPGFVVYNPATLLRLRGEVGAVLGVNFDPSHLFWQGIDPLVAVRALGPAIHHVHAKDTALHPANVAVNGVLDLESPSEVDRRSWIFRSVGDGHDLGFWTAFIDALRDVGYDHVLSIEHEDRLATTEAGLARAVATLRAALGRQPSPAGEPA